MRGLIRPCAAVAGVVGLLAPSAPAAMAQAPAVERATTLAVEGLGGERALRDLDAVRLRATGRTFILDEGARPGDDASPAGTFRLRLDLGSDRLRADYVRTSLGTARKVSEVVVGRRGFITGADANFQPPGEKAMTSDRWAAVTREQRLLNPHGYVRALLSRPGRASLLPARRLRGSRHLRLRVRGDAVPVVLWIDAATGRLDRLTTADHNYNRGDVQLAVDYRRWRAANGGLRFPHRVTLAQDGELLHDERRSRVRVNPSLSDGRFRFPSGVNARYDRALAARGARTTAWLMSFAHLGFVKDGAADEIVPRVVATGSTLIQGNANQSMVVEQQDGIVVVEGALHDYRAEALIDYVERTFPGKPIRHVTVSHHHADHAGGMRPFVALGARPVVHEDAVAFFERVFAVRGSDLLTDRLDESDAQADILAVPGTAPVTLPDPLRPVTVLAEPTEHATTSVLVFVPREGVLFVSGDTYTPGGQPGPGARTLDETIRANGLAVSWIVGGHGGVISHADFQAALAQP